MTCPSPTDSCSTPSAGCRSSTRRSWRVILGEAHATVHRALTDLLADGIAGRVSQGTAQLPSSQRYDLTANGIGDAAGFLGFETPSNFVRAYPVSREWLALLIRRMDAVAAVYRLASSLPSGTGSRRSHVEFHRRGRFDATITLHDGRSLYDRLRAIAGYDYTHAALKPPLCCQPPLPTGALCATADTMTATATSTICPR